MKVYGYTRVSTHRRDKDVSCELQAEQLLRRYPNMAECFVDDGVSGSVSLFDRPSGKKLRAVLAPGDVIVLTKLDRGFRSVDDFSTTARELGDGDIDIGILSINGGEPLQKNAMSRLFVNMLACFAEFELSMIAERTAEGRAAAVAEGKHIGGKPPFGFLVSTEGMLIEDSWRGACVKYILGLREKGYSLRAIADAASKHYPGDISHATVAKLIKDSLQ